MTGALRGKRRVLAKMSLRRSQGRITGTINGVPQGAARLWKKVIVAVGEGSASRFGFTFSNNYVTPPTTVFDFRVVWPSVEKKPSTNPAPWATPGLGFPFRRPWTYTGQNDLIVDFGFFDGRFVDPKLTKWSGADYSFSGVESLKYRNRSVGFASTHGRDCSGPNRQPVALSGEVSSYHFQSGWPGREDKLALEMTGRGSPGSVYVAGLGLRGVTDPNKGVKLGTCQPLMVSPVLTPVARADSRGFFYFTHLVPYDPDLTGQHVYAQVAYTDSLNNRFSLTKTLRMPIPVRPTPIMEHGSSIRAWSVAAQSGLFETRIVPLMRFD